MNFNEAENYLLSLGNEVSAMKLGLENIRKLLQALGDPQTKFLKVQVAGTNGKGSVCAFVNSICLAAGIQTGMFTSPHLVSITERVQINGSDISEVEFARFSTIVRDAGEKLVASREIENIPTFFEQVTAIALVAFAEANVQLAILETGLGGRLDATTAANAEIAAITRIDYDHQQYLGDTIEEIAAEKAAIVQRDTQTVVIGKQEPAAMRVILDRCREIGATVVDDLHSRWTVEPTTFSDARVELTTITSSAVTLGLRGMHQFENAETAINIIQSLLYDCGIPFEDEDIIIGLQTARHPGRLERSGQFLFDGAHNVGGARVLGDYLEHQVHSPITMVFAAMDDKDVKEIASILFPHVRWLILTRPDNPRAMTPEKILELIPPSVNKNSVWTFDDVESGVTKALSITPKRKTIVVTGSLYLVGEVKEVLERLKIKI